jgi:hypothetical protein
MKKITKVILMRCLMCLLMCLLMAGISRAAGTYSVQLGGDSWEVKFTPGPFGPGEMGYADVSVNGNWVAEYPYSHDTGSLFYEVYGLGTFFKYDYNHLILYKDLLGEPLVQE